MNTILIAGGAGFIGFHAVQRYFSHGHTVHVVDNLSRNGSRENLRKIETLRTLDSRRIHFHHVDLRNSDDVRLTVAAIRPDLIIHEAAQVAVTLSVREPRHDFNVNATGTFNLLEATRTEAPEAFFIYASTNKVYGEMSDVAIIEDDKQFRYRDYPDGVNESHPLDFHSPYACSKGAADQYVHDYARIFDLRTTVFRQSCIYGTHQYGIEDQGWIAWFTIARVLKKPVTIYGSGKQVRDVLWVEDLIDAYDAAWRKNTAGAVYNMGGGADNTLSLLDLVELLDEIQPTTEKLFFSETRPGDQPVYIANANKARLELQWTPRVRPADGVRRLHSWVVEHRDEVARVLES